jgi:hypothetical protein
MPDFDKLYDVMDFIDQNPKLHDQAIWAATSSCGTTACFAGWTALRNGYHLDGRDNFRRDSDGVSVSPSDVAEGILGLTYNQAAFMFWGTRTRAELRGYIDSLRRLEPVEEPVEKPESIDIDAMLVDEEIIHEHV